MENLNDIIELENTIKSLIQETRDSIANDVKAKPLNNVKSIGHFAATVSLSNLSAGLILTPEFYFPDMQAEYVTKALSSVKTASDFVSKLDSMIKEEGVKIGANFYRFNDVTLSVLRKYRL